MSGIRLLAFLAVTGLCATQASAQEVLIGSVPVTLGDSQAAVLKKLNAQYRVDSTGMVWKRVGPPFKVLGAVNFTAGRLTFVNRGWEATDPTEPGAYQATVRALRQLADQPGQSCTVTSQHFSDPESDLERVTVKCGNHSITISSGSVGAEHSFGIEEMWTLRR